MKNNITIQIPAEDYAAFIKACKLQGIETRNVGSEEHGYSCTIMYNEPYELFYLGRILEIKKRII